MSYTQEVRWHKRHRKGTRQQVIMSTGSGFWPSGAFLEAYAEYQQQCAAQGIQPLTCREYYESCTGEWGGAS